MRNPKRLAKNIPGFNSWAGMIQRCKDINKDGYQYYGGRGITVCERWETFANFLEDMGEKPEGLTLDRIDRDGNYEPSNCRWASLSEQARNKKDTHHLTLGDVTKPLIAWAEELGVNPNTFRMRKRYGWNDERIITTPARKWGR